MSRVARPSKTMQEAEAAVEAARHMADKPAMPEAAKRKSRQCRNSTLPVPFWNYRDKIASAETGTTQGRWRNGTTIYISGRGAEEIYAPPPQRQHRQSPPAHRHHLRARRHRHRLRRRAQRLSAAPTLAFPLIDGFYRIAGRADPMMSSPSAAPTLPPRKAKRRRRSRRRCRIIQGDQARMTTTPISQLAKGLTLRLRAVRNPSG